MYIWLVGSALSDFQLLLSLNKPLPTLHHIYIRTQFVTFCNYGQNGGTD
ncbi:hypothetical protein LYNGBM3L_19590 [Moorena producens 3L]|uniref:Uncharacterized protein n=1 Tax=Moorena producens 3L TaxID=489825 RepID=F4XSR1_9CYAN|nr:hypothetical protein LYNGBM3L_19590 [Moorena producens 3L]